jgi:two-component system CheB/CheR fusion protein
VLLQTLQSTARVGLGFVDRGYHYVRVNETLASINGRSVEEHLGRTAEVVPALWPRIEPVYRRVLGGDAVVNVEMTPATCGPLGDRCWLSRTYPVHLGAEIIGVGVVVVDITDLRRGSGRRVIDAG